MPSKSQLTGMRGVYLVAAELSRCGLVASPTSRSARGADILVTDQHCRRACSVQVKTNATTFSFWLLNSQAKNMVSPSHFYVLVNLNLRKDGEQIEYFIVPSRYVARRMGWTKTKKGDRWYFIARKAVERYRNRWDLLGK